MKKTADLLFGKTLSIEELLKKYPPRNLKEGAKVLRIAPSPTGYLHLGTFFSAFTQFIEARKTGGVFYIRLEDTDQKREIAGAGKEIVEMLQRFGVEPNEGYTGGGEEKGFYGPYVQSQRGEIYKAFAHRLVELGRAFPCFCEKTESKDDVLEKREQLLSEKGEISEKDVCRNLTHEEIEAKIKLGQKFAIRLKSAGDGNKTIKFTDFFKGEREIRENAKDIVLLKSDKMPTYALAHLADDTLMHTTMVVRGEEWFPSLAGHLELFLACNLKPPKYGHTPLICINDLETGNKRKLSKRKDPQADVKFFAEKGYPRQAIWEYVLNLANSNFEDWRKANPREDINKFDFKLSRLGSNNPMFDFAKLDDISKNVISRLSAEEIYEKTLNYAREFDSEFFEYLKNNKERAVSVFKIDRTPEKARKDITRFSDIKKLYNYIFFSIESYENFEIDKEVLTDYLNGNVLPLSKEEWFENIKKTAAKLNYALDSKEFKQNPQNFKGSITDVVTSLRVAITGQKNSPDLFEICRILGADEIEKRIRKVL